MTTKSLEHFSVKDRIQFIQGNGDFTKALLTPPSGARLEVYLYGAHISSWKPASGKEVLFLSSKTDYTAGKAIRGGIPVIFPQFSGEGSLPAHGFARNSLWQVSDTSVSTNGEITLKLLLTHSESTQRIWPNQFNVEFSIVFGERLQTLFRVKNTSDVNFQFTSALHTYFQVEDVESVAVQGLKWLKIVDFLKQRAESIETREEVFVKEFTDRVYASAPEIITLHDRLSKRKICIRKQGFADAVLWNPWLEKAMTMKDLPEADYKKFLCLEAGNVLNPVRLKPGQEHLALQEISVQPE